MKSQITRFLKRLFNVLPLSPSTHNDHSKPKCPSGGGGAMPENGSGSTAQREESMLGKDCPSPTPDLTRLSAAPQSFTYQVHFRRASPRSPGLARNDPVERLAHFGDESTLSESLEPFDQDTA